MTVAGYATVPVVPGMADFKAQLQRKVNADMAAVGRTGGREFGDAAGREAGRQFNTRFRSMVKNVGAPVLAGLAGAGVLGIFNSLKDSASDAQQSVGGVQAVFKGYADGVIQDSARADQALGLSKTAYQELVTVTGALLKNKGIQDFADQAEFVLKTGADLAAQYGGPTKDAVEALNAALRGESDPIERYAVSLNESTVNAVLAANGQSKLTGASLEQAKTMARLQLIMQQTSDAQGAFAREADTAAGASARASAEWANQRAELGQRLLPTYTAFVTFLNEEGLPTIEKTGGVVADATRTFDGLPAPVKAATVALVAFKAAQALGAGDLAGSGREAVAQGLANLRGGLAQTSAGWKELRAATLTTTESAHIFNQGMTRTQATLEMVRRGALGAGAGLRSGFSAVSNLVGGPWGAAFIGGTALVAHFWQEHQRAKQEVEEFITTLDKETGAITQTSREYAAKRLLDAGVLKDAKALGISLDEVTNAALGQKGALSGLNAELDATIERNTVFTGQGSFVLPAGVAAQELKKELNSTNGTVQEGIAKQKLLAEATGSAADATQKSAASNKTASRTMADYRSQIDQALTAMQKLLQKENERRNRNLGARQDRLAIVEGLQAARKEAADGARTLNENTVAGQKNLHALYDLAGQWNNSAQSVRNAKGAYANFRENFIQIARSMGATKTEANKLANEVLGLPKSHTIDVKTPGMEQARAELRKLRADLAAARKISRIIITTQGAKNQADNADRFASGGLLRGPGTGTSDSILMWGSNGEYMQRKAAVDHYGIDFMNRLNALQIPKYANGGGVGVATAAPASPLGHEIRGVLSIDRDGQAYFTAVTRREISAEESRATHKRRMTALNPASR